MKEEKDITMGPAEAIAKESDRKLKKSLSLQDLFFLSMGGIIGSGWLLGVAGAAGVAGPASILSMNNRRSHSLLHSANICGSFWSNP